MAVIDRKKPADRPEEDVFYLACNLRRQLKRSGIGWPEILINVAEPVPKGGTE